MVLKDKYKSAWIGRDVLDYALRFYGNYVILTTGLIFVFLYLSEDLVIYKIVVHVNASQQKSITYAHESAGLNTCTVMQETFSDISFESKTIS